MSKSSSSFGEFFRGLRQQVGAGYAITLLLATALTWALLAVEPHLPLGKFPMTYIILTMASAYLFGEGPAIFSFFLGLLAFNYFFAAPARSIWPLADSPEGWAGQVAFFLGTWLAGITMVLIRKSRRRLQQAAQRLEEAVRLSEERGALVETLMRNVPVGLGFHDRETRHILANPALAALNAMTLEELLGKTVRDVLPEELGARAEETIRKVFDTGEPSVWRDLEVMYETKRFFDVMHVPVKLPGHRTIGVGVVVVETTEQILARRELERLYEREHHIAETLQEALRARVPSRMSCLSLETVYRPAMEEALVGGDFYDAFRLDHHRVGLVIADVSGKGLKAAVQVAMARYSLRGRAYEHDSPAKVLELVNETLARDLADGSFVTVFLGVLDCASGTLTYASGGHGPVFHWRKKSADATILEPTGPPLGAMTGMMFNEHTLHIRRDDELLLVTDGLLALKLDGRYLQEEDLQQGYVRLKNAGDFTAERFVDEMMLLGGGRLRDDIAVLKVLVGEKCPEDQGLCP